MPKELTKRRKIILTLTAQGLLAKDIGHQLNISARTVENILRKVRIDFNCNNTTHLVAKLITLKLIDGE